MCHTSSRSYPVSFLAEFNIFLLLILYHFFLLMSFLIAIPYSLCLSVSVSPILSYHCSVFSQADFRPSSSFLPLLLQRTPSCYSVPRFLFPTLFSLPFVFYDIRSFSLTTAPYTPRYFTSNKSINPTPSYLQTGCPILLFRHQALSLSLPLVFFVSAPLGNVRARCTTRCVGVKRGARFLKRHGLVPKLRREEGGSFVSGEP